MNIFGKNKFNQIVTLIFFAALVFYFVNSKEALSELLDVPIWVVILLLFLQGFRVFLNGFFTRFTLEAFDKKVSLKETNYLAFLTSAGNFFGPILGGASIRAVYLKKRHNFKYASFVATLYGYYVLVFLTNTLIGMVALAYLFSQSSDTPGLVAVFTLFLGIFIANLLLVLLPSRWLHRLIEKLRIVPQKIREAVETMVEGWEIIRLDKRLMTKLFMLNFVIFTIAVAEGILLYSLFVEDFSLASVVIYTVLGTVSLLISFTPGAIGIKEAIYLLTSSVLALSSTQIIQLATVDRSVTFILITLIFLYIKASRMDKLAE